MTNTYSPPGGDVQQRGTIRQLVPLHRDLPVPDRSNNDVFGVSAAGTASREHPTVDTVCVDLAG